MASPSQGMWVWVSSGSWWWTRKSGVLQSMVLQRLGQDWATELNWTYYVELCISIAPGQWGSDKTTSGYPQVKSFPCGQILLRNTEYSAIFQHDFNFLPMEKVWRDFKSDIHCENLLLLLVGRFSRVRLCATPEMAAHQAPPSLGFSRQEHWSGLPFPSPMRESEIWKWSRSVVSDSSYQAPPSMGFSLPLGKWNNSAWKV